MSRAPSNGLKLMIAAALVFAFLAAYGEWEYRRQPETIKITTKSGPVESVSPSPNDR